MSTPTGAKPGDSYPRTLDMEPQGPTADAFKPRVPTPLGTLPSALGSYELGDVLGKGGMGVVYKAHDRNLDRPAAVKVLAPEMRVYPEALERLRAEARAAARLNHPGIVAVYALGDDAEWTWIAMEFVEGENLARLVRLGGAIPPGKATRYIRQAAEALDFAARQRVVHRDIKPANIMITQADDARVMDFGLARCLDSDVRLTNTGATPGTPEYMSPEQALARDFDHRTDIYSLGCTYYTLLAGHAPFSGSSATEVIMKHVSQRMELPREWRGVAGGKINTLIERMTAKEPADRPQRWTEIVEALREIEGLLDSKKEGSSILQTPASSPGSRPFMVQSEPKSRAIIFASLAALGVFVVGGLAVAFWPESKPLAVAPLTNARSGDPLPRPSGSTDGMQIAAGEVPQLELTSPSPAAMPTPYPTPQGGPPPDGQGGPRQDGQGGPGNSGEDPRVSPGATSPSAMAARLALTEGRWSDAATALAALRGRDYDSIKVPVEVSQAELNEGFAAARLAEAGLLASANPPAVTPKEKGDAAIAHILATAGTMSFEQKWAAVLYLTFLGRPEAIEYAESLAKNSTMGPQTGRPLNMLYVAGAFMNPLEEQRWQAIRPPMARNGGMRPGGGRRP